MSYSIIAVPTFKKELKKLAKKHLSLKEDLTNLFEQLAINPTLGTPIGKNCYKIRLAITSKNKGKSGGTRLITNFVISDEIIYLLSI
jgi:mRNA-degrading endonuclease RelE of RelBE toxin-antitoxin system